ncbi:unnamed protein product [Cladocopium goreaui]|uniref:Uncharacterized protein n=1 Tax=Cladocopium goreaui TaxID=2562237 RepID=A0A9P1D0Z8_9DINO|nr:unnamed protein product [Cladocopium goreaui]
MDLSSMLWALNKLKAPREFLKVVVLVYFTSNLFNLEEDFRWLEYFAGQASCTFEMRQAGFRSARFDKLYCQDPGAHGRKTNWMDLTTPAGFALAVVFVMKGMELDLLSWFGIKCSSLVAVNSGTSKRSACNSIGLSCPSVDESNTLLERTICLCMLVTAKQGSLAR